MRRALLLSLMVVIVASGCVKGDGKAAPGVTTTGPAGSAATTPGSTTPGAASIDRYEAAVDAAAARDLAVWLDADLATRWRAGKDRFRDGVQRLARLAARPGVVGIKVADELGYKDGFDSEPDQLRAFLTDTKAALSEAAPGRLILVDLVVPALGCAGSGKADCVKAADGRYPALALQELDRVFSDRLIDVANISTGLLGEHQYTAQGTDRESAQRAAWAEIARRQWDQGVRLQSRKALAHAGTYEGGAARAEADLKVFLDIPLASGAAAVDVWTWHRTYNGEVVRLMDPGLTPNPLWAALKQRRAAKAELLTHFTPSSVEVGLERDLDLLAEGFTGVFIAAGLG